MSQISQSSYSDNDSDFDPEELEDIFEYEEALEEHECQDGEYVIGSVALYYTYHIIHQKRRNPIMVIDLRVDPRIFFKFDYPRVNDYFHTCNPHGHLFDQLEIIQVSIQDNVSYAVIKTRWLRVVQRAWKGLMKQRREWLQYVKKNIVSFVTHQRLPPYPSCHGILRM